MLDRIALCEVWATLAHDYGLYALYTRILSMGFQPRPTLKYDTLDEDQRLYYLDNEHRAAKMNSLDTKIPRS